jgi:succinate-semialdehyde dehydrogenase/glutarate-semialdehyde dehydrogenase
MKTINPATGHTEAEFRPHGSNEIEARLAKAATAQIAWAETSATDRSAFLNAVAQALRADSDRLAKLITLEMGKVFSEAQAEIAKCAVCCEHYADHAESYLDPVEIASNASLSTVAFEPLGAVLAVMPWNYPFWQFVRFAAPALAAGNAVLLKHASNVPQCALALEAVFRKAGAPDGLVTTLLVGSDAVAGLIADDRVAAVTLTGSTQAGAIVAAQAGAQIKKQVLELGGSDAFIVLEDADVAEAARVGVRARFQNAGQSCIAAKRFIVVEEVVEEFTRVFVEEARKLVVGDPTDPATSMGPMAQSRLRDELHAQVQRSVSDGARLLLGGTCPEGPGAFYPATVMDNVTPQMTAFQEETFGPLAAIITAKDADEAIALANATEFGLGAALWTGDAKRGAVFARRIEAGAVFINGMVASDSRLPFGGIGKSGYGRELGEWGIREFTNVKLIWTGPAR